MSFSPLATRASKCSGHTVLPARFGNVIHSRVFSLSAGGYDDCMNKTVSIKDLVALQEQMRQCRSCAEAGYPITARAIFSGAVTAQIMIVGQAPGEREEARGRRRTVPSSRGTRRFYYLP